MLKASTESADGCSPSKRMAERIPPELARRIDALEDDASQQDFDRRSWLWLVMLGVVLPLLLLIVGWQL